MENRQNSDRYIDNYHKYEYLYNHREDRNPFDVQELYKGRIAINPGYFFYHDVTTVAAQQQKYKVRLGFTKYVDDLPDDAEIKEEFLDCGDVYRMIYERSFPNQYQLSDGVNYIYCCYFISNPEKVAKGYSVVIHDTVFILTQTEREECMVPIQSLNQASSLLLLDCLTNKFEIPYDPNNPDGPASPDDAEELEESDLFEGSPQFGGITNDEIPNFAVCCKNIATVEYSDSKCKIEKVTRHTKENFDFAMLGRVDPKQDIGDFLGGDGDGDGEPDLNYPQVEILCPPPDPYIKCPIVCWALCLSIVNVPGFGFIVQPVSAKRSIPCTGGKIWEPDTPWLPITVNEVAQLTNGYVLEGDAEKAAACYDEYDIY